MADHATATVDDDRLHKITVLQVLLRRLVDDLEALDTYVTGQGDLDRDELRDQVGHVLTLAIVADEEANGT